MKMKHDVDATTLGRKKTLVGTALALAILAGSVAASAPVQDTGKMRHDCCVWHVPVR